MGGLTGVLLLDWAILAVSLFNTILLLWLGITLVLSADRHTAGVWLVGGGAFAGALFFVSHTAILGQEMAFNLDGLDFWWRVGWTPITIAPYAWYAVMLWHNGFRLRDRSRLSRRHALPFLLMTILALAFVILFLTTNVIPSYDQIIQLDLSGVLTVGGTPLLLVLFPLFMVGCILLAVDVLRQPPPLTSSDSAHMRSRPWLLAASAILLLVSLMVALFIVGIITQTGATARIDVAMTGWIDLGLSFLISLATILMGQAIVAYEVFTGKPLPRRGLFQHWRNTIVIALVYSAVVAWSLVTQLRPIYSLLLTTLLMVLFYALYSWRTFVERERFMRDLRPFVGTQHLIANLLDDHDDASQRAQALFNAVSHLLGTERAQLIPMGTLAALVGEPLVYPPQRTHAPLQAPTDLHTHMIALDAAAHDGHVWAIPLWTERGLIGCLMIGRKLRNGIYTQEEIDIAQASGERIIDMLAGEKMARALVGLQRKRLTQTRVVDLRTRRTLHDDVLPAIHTAILDLSSAARNTPSLQDTQQALSNAHRQIADLIRDIPGLAHNNESTSELTALLRKNIESEFNGVFTSITWNIETSLFVPTLEAEIITGGVRELVRNAAAHGRGTQAERGLNLKVSIRREQRVTLCVQDDGVGIGNAARSGSGSGLTLHSTLLALIGGGLSVAAGAAGGTWATITLPDTLFQAQSLDHHHPQSMTT